MSEIEAKKNSAITFQFIALPAGALIGLLLGLAVPGVMLGAEFLGRIFFGLLTLFVIPVIVTATISGIAGLGHFSRLGNPLGRVVLFFAITTVAGVLLGGLSGWLLAPGSAIDASHAAMLVSPVGSTSTTLSGLLSGIVGGQILQMASTETYLGLVLLALALGVTLSSMGNAGRTAMSLFRAVNDALMRLIGLLMYAAPFGILFLVGGAVARQAGLGSHWISLLGGLTLAVAAALLIQGAIVLPLALQIVGGRSPLKLLTGLTPALLTGFGVGSSAATLPVTYRCAIGSGQVEPRAAAVALPLGMVINRSGTAVYMMVAALFMAQFFGVAVGLVDIVLLALVTLALSMLAAATPMAILLTLPVVLSLLGLDPAQAALGTGIVAAGDWLLNRLATVVNIWGDGVGGALLSAAPATQPAARRSAERRPARQTSDRPPREPRDRGPREPRDRTRGRRDGRDARVAGHRTERRPDLPPVLPRAAAARPSGGRPVRDENSPFAIRTSDRPILESTPHDDASPAARPPESRPPLPERRSEPTGGGRPPRGSEFNRSRGGGRRPMRQAPTEDDSRPATPERTEPETTPGRMSQTKVARELTRVTEHLRRIESEAAKPSEDDRRVADDVVLPEAPDSVEEPEMMTAAEVYARRAAEEPELELDLEAELEGESEEEAETELEGPDDSDSDIPEADDEESPEWGRTRRHRGLKRRGDEGADESKSTEEPEVESQESFSNEQVSFGRAKRKKHRS